MPKHTLSWRSLSQCVNDQDNRSAIMSLTFERPSGISEANDAESPSDYPLRVQRLLRCPSCVHRSKNNFPHVMFPCNSVCQIVQSTQFFGKLE